MIFDYQASYSKSCFTETTIAKKIARSKMALNLLRIVTFVTLLSVFKFTLATPSSRISRHHRPRHHEMSISEMQARASNDDVRRGAEMNLPDDTLPMCVNNVNKKYIPDQFDARRKWSYCPSLWEITDQGECQSCWALAVASSLTDRYCIYQRGADYFQFSADDLLSCGANETAWNSDDGISGCRGGNVPKAFKYIQERGVVSGGPFRPSRGWGCKPYEIPPCNHKPHQLGLSHCGSQRTEVDTPECVRDSCQSFYDIPYAEDIKTLPQACTVNSTVEDIQTEIMRNGPVVAVMKLWNSFFTFDTSKVYQKVYIPNDFVQMNHAVKIVGWGTEVENGKEVPYWLCANSFNYYWGQDGFFKIARGAYEVGAYIESHVTAGIFEQVDRNNIIN